MFLAFRFCIVTPAPLVSCRAFISVLALAQDCLLHANRLALSDWIVYGRYRSFHRKTVFGVCLS